MTPLVHARRGATITATAAAVVVTTAGMILRHRTRALEVEVVVEADGEGRTIGVRVAGEVVREEGVIGRATS